MDSVAQDREIGTMEQTMTSAEMLRSQTTLPVVVAPMFMVSGPEIVVESCKAGVVGTVPALNSRTVDEFEGILQKIHRDLKAFSEENPSALVAPYGVNLVVRQGNERLEEDLELCAQYKSPIVITIMGKPTKVVDTVHAYGGIVFSDVTTVEFAKKAADCGPDGLVLVCAGAGGHAGRLNPFAFVSAVREFFDGILLVGGCISTGGAIRAVEAMGADFAYMGTRFIPTAESLAQDEYKQMIVDSEIKDIIYTPAVSGMPANFMRSSLDMTGFDLSNPADIRRRSDATGEANAWRDVWSAGQGVQTIRDVSTVRDVVRTLKNEYDKA